MEMGNSHMQNIATDGCAATRSFAGNFNMQFELYTDAHAWDLECCNANRHGTGFRPDENLWEDAPAYDKSAMRSAFFIKTQARG